MRGGRSKTGLRGSEAQTTASSAQMERMESHHLGQVASDGEDEQPIRRASNKPAPRRRVVRRRDARAALTAGSAPRGVVVDARRGRRAQRRHADSWLRVARGGWKWVIYQGARKSGRRRVRRRRCEHETSHALASIGVTLQRPGHRDGCLVQQWCILPGQRRASQLLRRHRPVQTYRALRAIAPGPTTRQRDGSRGVPTAGPDES